MTRVKWDTSKVHPSIKATKNLPQTVRINFFQNSGKQMLAGIQGAHVPGKKAGFWEKQLVLWHFNLPQFHLQVPSSVVALKISTCILVVTPDGVVCVYAQSRLALWDPTDGSPQAPLSMEFSRQEHWSRLPFPTPKGLPEPRIQTTSMVLLHWQVDF